MSASLGERSVQCRRRERRRLSSASDDEVGGSRAFDGEQLETVDQLHLPAREVVETA
jgi:hypothetical protein